MLYASGSIGGSTATPSRAELNPAAHQCEKIPLYSPLKKGDWASGQPMAVAIDHVDRRDVGSGDPSAAQTEELLTVCASDIDFNSGLIRTLQREN